MLSIGKNIQANADALQKIPVDYLFNRLKHPKQEIEALIRQLRAIREIDARQYTLQKRALPYFVCAVFNPPYRKTENFAYAEYFVLDLDHISDGENSLKAIRESVQKDPHVLLAFTSPSGDGLKLMFKLNERCWDSGIYSLFYKAFSRSFGAKHNLSDIIDSRTSDVCRACFISMDPDVYFNPQAEPVDVKDYLETDDVSSMFTLKKELEKSPQPTMPAAEAAEPQSSDPDAETMKRIRQVLAGKPSKESDKAAVYVPQELDMVLEGLTLMLRENGLDIESISNIQYGKNIRVRLGLKKAEVNLFFGKRGFTVVACPRTGTNAELNHLCSGLIRNHLNQFV